MADSFDYFSGANITTGTLYKTSYCLTILEANESSAGENHTCIQWQEVWGIDKTELKEIGVSILWNSFVFLSVLFVLGWITKVLFAKLFNRGKS